METLPDRTKAHDEVILLKKTDSCDSGITKSDLRLDSVGEGVTQTPQDCSPVQAAGAGGAGGAGEGERLFQVTAERLDVQTALLELRQELRGEMRAFSSRITALEGHLAEMLRLLRVRTGSASTTPHLHPSQQADQKDTPS